MEIEKTTSIVKKNNKLTTKAWEKESIHTWQELKTLNIQTLNKTTANNNQLKEMLVDYTDYENKQSKCGIGIT